MPTGSDLQYLLERAIPDALEPIVRQAVGDVIPRVAKGDRYRIAHTGRFGSRIAADLLAFFRNQRLDGALLVLDVDVVRAIFFRGGRVVGASSDCLFERLGRVLLRGELVDAPTADRLNGVEETSGLAAAASGVAPEIARWGLETRVWDIVASLFLVHDGHFVIVEGTPALGDVPPLDLSPTDLALEGLRRYDEWRNGKSAAPRTNRRAPDSRPPDAPPAAKAPPPATSPAIDDLLDRLRSLG